MVEGNCCDVGSTSYDRVDILYNRSWSIELQAISGTLLRWFISKNKSSEQVSKELVRNKIATRNDNFYAWRCLKAIGVDVNDGIVRLSLTHYNTKEEVEKLINVLKTI